ncbi:MAG TPA: phosphohistidine phosphatase SixA [Aggregatilineales bacterium]|nr:phosphohistidine phosphatase SixA [Aggregatilineales bacterium]
MMVELYLLRHGVAFEREEWQDKDDELRPLTKKGIAKMEAEAKALKHSELNIEYVISSPLTRAAQTAQIVADALDKKVVESKLLKPGCDLKALATLLKEYDGTERILIVGHEPDFSTLIGQIVGGGSVELRKGGIACCELNSVKPPKGTLRWLLTPEWLGA